MAADGSVIIEITGDDRELRKMLGSLKSVTGAALKGLTAAVATAGGAVAGLGAAAAKVGSEFESSLAATSTMFGDVAVNTEGLKAQILELSGATGLAATEISGSLYNALSAGIPATEDMSGAMDYMEQCAKLAAAGFTDVDTAVTATAKVMNAYGMGLGDVDKIQKIMLQTQNKGITTVDELGATLAQVTPTAAAMGVSFENVGAALATMTAQGTPTAQATTQLNSLIAELGKNGTLAAKNLTKAAEGTQYAGMGFGDMMAAGVPLNEVLNLMGDYAEKNGLSMIDMFSSIEAGKSALAMAGENSDAFASNLAAMSTEADLVGDAYSKVTDTLEHKVEVLKESVKNLGIAAYDGMKETLGEAVELANGALSDIAAAFEKDGLQGAVDAAGGAMSKVVGEIAKAAPKLVDAAFDLMKAFADGLWAQRGEIAKAAQDVAIAAFEGLGEAIPMISPLTDTLAFLTKNLKTITPVAVAAASAFVAFKVIGTTTTLVQGATTAFQLAQVQVALYAAANGRAAVATAAANGTFKLTEIVVALMTKQLTIAQAASIGLKAAMTALSGPIGIAVMAVAAIGGGLLAYKLTAGQSEDATESLSARMKDLNKTLDEQKQSQDELAARRGEALAGVEAEIDMVEGYVDELSKLVDANGKVKAGYESRAAYLAEQINTVVPNAVAVNADEAGSIYAINAAIEEQIFLREKAMTIEALQADYMEAKKNILQAEMDVTEAYRQQGAKLEELNAIHESFANNNSQTGMATLDTKVREVTKEYEACTREIQEAEAVLGNYQGQIDAMNAVQVSKTQKELEESTRSLSTEIVRSTGINTAALEEAVADSQVNYDRLKMIHETTQASMTEEDRKASEDRLAKAKASLDAQVEVASKAGINIPKEFAGGVWSGAYLYPEAILALLADGEKELENSTAQANALGKNFTSGFARGIANKAATGNVWGAAWDMAGLALQAVQTRINSNSPSKETMKLGGFTADGFALGIDSGAKDVSSAAWNLGESAITATKESLDINSPSGEFEALGWYTTEGFVKGMKDSEGKVIKTAAELSEAVLKAATEWVEEKTYYNELAAKDELAFWEDLKQLAGLEGKELAKIDRNIYKARQEASKESFEHSKKWIEQETFYQRLSAEEAVEAWERVVERKNLSSEQQLEAEKNLFTARQNLLKEQETAEKALAAEEKKLADEQQKRVDEYEQTLNARVDSLRSFAGLFSEVDKKTEVSGKELLKNLEDQVKLFKGWQADMVTLAGKDDMSEALLAKLREMGPKASAEIHAIANMADDDFARYVGKFSELGGMIQTQAETELADQAIELPVNVAVTTREQAAKAVGDSVTAMCEAADQNTERLCASADNMAEAMLESFQKYYADFYNVGVEAMRGLNNGLEIQGRVAIDTARDIANSIIWEMQRAMDIHSPSRKMRDLVGKPAAQGFLLGFEEEMARFHRLAQETVERETGKLNAQVSAQMSARSAAQGVTREIHTKTNTIEKVARFEGDGLTGEVVRMMNLKLKAEDARIGKRMR